MRRTLRSRTLAPLIAIVTMACNTEQPTTIDDVIAAHTEARGGAAAIESIQSIRLVVEVVEPEFTVVGDYVASRDGLMRVDIRIGDELVYVEALGEDRGWQWNAGDTVSRGHSAEGEAALQRGVHTNLFGLHELRDLGYGLTLVGSEETDEGEFWIVDRTGQDGFVTRLFLDKTTSLIDRDRSEAALHPDMDPTVARHETYYDSYEAIGGVLYSHGSRKIDMDTREEVQRTKILRAGVNPEIDPSMFLPPEEADDGQTDEAADGQTDEASDEGGDPDG